MSEFTTELLPIADLVEHKRNARHHPEHQLAALEARFRALGWYKNVVVARWKKRLMILAGHGIIAGAKRAGATHAPCHVREIDPMSPEAIDILEGDNTAAEFAEDDQTQRLANLLMLQESGRLESTGYDDGLLEALKGQLQAEQKAKEPPEDPGPEEPPAEPVTKAGDVWCCGEHRVGCLDCRDPASWDLVCAGQKVNVVFTSPPYAEQRKAQYGGVPASEYVEWFRAVADNVAAHIAEDGSFFVNLKAHCEGGERETYDKRLVLAMREWGWRFVDELCWLRRSYPGALDTRFKNAWEPVFHFAQVTACKCRPKNVLEDFKQDPSGYKNYRDYGHQQAASGSGFELGQHVSYDGDGARPDNVITANHSPQECLHPACFPVDLADFFVRAYTDPGDSVVDCFGGSGTAMVAAEATGRRAVCIEQHGPFVDVSVRRWCKLTGRTAYLESDGTPFPVSE